MRHTYILVSLFGLLSAACASLSSTENQNSVTHPDRDIASIATLSPFLSGNQVSPSQLVDAVISKLGPARNQEDTQICFAQAVADVATFHSGQRVSAFSVAVRNFQSRRGFDSIFFNPAGVLASEFSSQSRYMLGLASSALASIRQPSLCKDDQPPSNLIYRDSQLKELWDVYQNQFRTYIGPTAPTQLFEKIKVELSLIMPSLDPNDFIDHIRTSKPLDYALGEWFDRSCKVRLQNPSRLKVVGSEMRLMSAEAIIGSLNAAMEAGEPAVIHYDPGVLDAMDTSIWKTVVGFHVSLIVARADLPDGRFYLLRNSWGPDCRIYAASVANRCDRGHVWLSESEIRKYVSSVAYLRTDN